MKNVIIGTAGHVDHGKTCLIKALSGTDTDRLKEEKARGITIENGFAELIQGDYHISIIDVPGHEKFVKNMLAGIGGIDMVLLVIGLDEGVMPQTIEHFEILKMLHIKKGIIVYTKDDLVSDEEWKQLVEEDGRSLVEGTFMEKAPSIRVSAHTGKNIDELRQLIIEMASDIRTRALESELFRLPIDRVFTIDGFGTVITGTLLEGSVAVGDEITLYPGDISVKVRNVQVHGENVERAYAGQRTALNLAGVKKEDVHRGEVLASKASLEATKMLDVKLEMFTSTEKTVVNNSRVHLYCGSSESICKVVLLNKEVLQPGESGYAQLRLEENFTVKRGDRFIIRFYSPVESIGGGVILDSNPVKHKRNDSSVISDLTVKEKGNITKVVELTIKELCETDLSLKRLGDKLIMTRDECEEVVDKLQKAKKVYTLSGNKLFHVDVLKRIQELTSDILGKYHEENAISSGMAKEEFKNRLSRKIWIKNEKTQEALVEYLALEGIIVITGSQVSLKGFQVEYSPELQQLKDRVLNTYIAAKFEMPKVEEVLEAEKNNKNVKHVIDAMCTEKILTKINYMYYLPTDYYNQAKNIVAAKVNENGSITLGEFRDAIGASRKYAVVLLEHMDEVKFTKKIDDARILAEV